MGIIDTLKETVGLIQKVDNIELYKRMLELQTQAVSLVDENKALKEKITTRDELTFKKNSYWRGDDGPFCSPCWDKDNHLVRLHLAPKHSASPQCPVCHHYAIDPDASRPIQQRQREGRTGAGPEPPRGWGRRGGY